MSNSEWVNLYEIEISKALSARAQGNEGMARVCARRSLGIILVEFFSRLSISFPQRSAYEQIKLFITLPLVSDELKEIAEQFLIHVNPAHNLPIDVDLISEAQYLKHVLLDTKESTMNDKYLLIQDLISQIDEIPPDSTLSRTIYNDGQIKVVLFGFSPGQELSEHTASMPAIIQILEGDSKITIANNTINGQPGTWIHLPANQPHSIHAITKTVMLLTLIKSKT